MRLKRDERFNAGGAKPVGGKEPDCNSLCYYTRSLNSKQPNNQPIAVQIIPNLSMPSTERDPWRSSCGHLFLFFLSHSLHVEAEIASSGDCCANPNNKKQWIKYGKLKDSKRQPLDKNEAKYKNEPKNPWYLIWSTHKIPIRADNNR